MRFFKELKRRNVFKETLAYLVVAWVILQVGSIVLPIFDSPPWVLKTLTFILILGLPVWVIFSWTYQVTSEGFIKTSRLSEESPANTATFKRLNLIILITLLIAIALALINPAANLNLNEGKAKLAMNNSVAVIPFLDVSADQDQEYLSIGIAEDILNRLCKFKELSIIASTSSFSFRDKSEDIKTIGKKLNARNILEGSVRKNEDEIIISVRLSDVETGTVLLQETYTDALENVVSLQSNIAMKIAKKIDSELSDTGEKLLKQNEIDAQAFESYLKGRSQFVSGPLNMLPNEILRAKKYFETAVEQDSTFAEAHAYLSLTYFNLADWALPRTDLSEIENALDSAAYLAKRAFKLDSLNSGARLAMGSYYFHKYDWINAEKEKRRAVALNPGGTEEKFILSSFLGQFGQGEEALELDREALRLDPLDIRSRLKYVRDLYRTRRFDEGIKECKSILSEEPNSSGAYQFLGFFYLAKNQDIEAADAWHRYSELLGDTEQAGYFKDTDFQTGISKMLDHTLATIPPNIRSPIFLAWYHAILENKDSTFKYLNFAVEKRQPQISFISQPFYDFLRNDPRYDEIYELAGFKAYDERRLEGGN